MLECIMLVTNKKHRNPQLEIEPLFIMHVHVKRL